MKIWDLPFFCTYLAAIRHVSDRIAIMYLGRIVELADAQTIVDRPQHPYTQALLSAVQLRSSESSHVDVQFCRGRCRQSTHRRDVHFLRIVHSPKIGAMKFHVCDH